MYSKKEYKKFRSHVLYAVRAYKQLVDDHCINGDYAHEIAKKYNITRNALQKGFKSLYGIDIRDYKLKLRMERGRAMLAECKDVKEVSIVLHYTTPRAFSFAFKKFYGFTPTEFTRNLPVGGNNQVIL